MDNPLSWLKFSDAELMALLGIFLIGYAATETIKRLTRHLFNRAVIDLWRSDVIWIVSILASTIAAAGAWPDASVLPWWIVGIGAGALNSVAVKLAAAALHKIAPQACAAFTGNRRRRDEPTPASVDRRS
jgi:hypothetical protein